MLFLLFVAFQLQLCQQAVPRERLIQRVQEIEKGEVDDAKKY